MKNKKLTPKEINEVFEILNIKTENTDNYCPVWEVPPIKRGTKISINTNVG